MTHAVCPLCGKSSSLKSFPNGPGNEILIQVFEARGRGKGFRVGDRHSAMDDAALCTAVKEKVLEIVSLLSERGYLKVEELERSVGADARKRLHRAEELLDLWQERARKSERQAEEANRGARKLERRGKQLIKENAFLGLRFQKEMARRKQAEEVEEEEFDTEAGQEREARDRVVDLLRDHVEELRSLVELAGLDHASAEDLIHDLEGKADSLEASLAEIEAS